ncbi:MAG: NAD(P)/FAD-dependent oxidoreductase [Syntrophomonadaceae bacterium]|nr:NAD(P)/FAD-dependent oxidoreductase [Syntrophomonadaceae bacterium]
MHVVILGAGPAGLAAGYELCSQGGQVTIVEKENQVGGISKTVEREGYRFDLGGHRFFTKIDEVEELWRETLGEEFLSRPRLSRIYYRNRFFDYPLKPCNALFSLGIMESLFIIASYLNARINPVRPEESFQDWVSNRFGRRLFNHFFKSYTEKVWGISCTELKAEWAAQRIKGLSLATAVINAVLGPLKKKNAIKTLIEEFNYPRLGPGMMYEAIAQKIIDRGGRILTDTSAVRICREGENVKAVEVRSKTGCGSKIEGDYVISSLPLRDAINMIDPAPAAEIVKAGNQLKYRDFLCVNIALQREYLFPDNWIYIHSPEVRLGRVQNFKQWSPGMVPESGCSSLGLEYFCNEGDELWRADDRELISMAVSEVARIGLIKEEWVKWGTVIRVPKAYPVYDEDYKKSIPLIREYLKGFNNLLTIGRNGLHRYNNMDHSILTGLLAARNICGGNYDLWEVNTDDEYHEEARRQC